MTDANVDVQRAAQRDLIRRMLAAVPGSTPTSLARAAGLAPSTLTRFLSQPVDHLLSARTLDKLLRASGLPPLQAERQLSHDPEEVMILRIWRALDRDDKIAVLRVLANMARDDKPQMRRRA